VVEETTEPTTPTTEPATDAPTSEPSPEPSASVGKVRETIKPCTSSSFVRAMIVIELRNEGTGWAELQGGDYTIYDNKENVIGTGNFTYSYPKYLAAGATGYLLEDTFIEDATAKEVKRVEADGTFVDADPNDVIQLKTQKVQVKREEFGGGLHTTGTVTNTSDKDVENAHVGSVFLDANERPLGLATTNLVENLSAGKTKGFSTLDSACAIKRTAVKKVITLAGDDNF
jgi:hypothetical protein